MGYLIAILLFTLDRLSKYAANTQLILNQPVFNTPVDIMLYHNTGIALSLNIPIIIPIITGILAISVIIYLTLKSDNGLHRALLAITAFGILSNLLDRIFLGYIVDYIKISRSIINIADIMIVLGIFSYIYYNKK